MNSSTLTCVMRGLGPRIHAFRSAQQDVDGRVKPGHDDVGNELSPSLRGATATKQSSPHVLHAMNWIASLRSQ
jgi:hypothetical protein